MIPYGQVVTVPPPTSVEVLHNLVVERLDFTERVPAESRGTRELKPGR